MLYCKHCGAQMNDTDRFCNVCGTRVAAAQEPEHRPLSHWKKPEGWQTSRTDTDQASAEWEPAETQQTFAPAYADQASAEWEPVETQQTFAPAYEEPRPPLKSKAGGITMIVIGAVFSAVAVLALLYMMIIWLIAGHYGGYGFDEVWIFVIVGLLILLIGNMLLLIFGIRIVKNTNAYNERVMAERRNRNPVRTPYHMTY